MQDPSPIPDPNDQPLDDDIPCRACGYNLRTRRPSQACPECGEGVDASIREVEYRRLKPALTLEGFGILTRVSHVLLGVLLPVASFVIVEVSGEPMLVEWQSGEWHHYIGMLLGGVPSRPFYPFLIFACVAMLALVKSPVRNGSKTWVCLGLIVGIVLSVQYTLILLGSMAVAALLPGLIAVGLGILPGLLLYMFPVHWLDWSIWSWFTPRYTWIVILSASLLGIIITGITGGAPIALVLIMSPWLCMTMYVLAIARVLRSRRLMGGATVENGHVLWRLWLSGGLMGYFLAWTGSIILAINEYAKLPTQQSDCYICTAAARGHARFVGSRCVVLDSGQTITANRQMRVLKATEVALRATSPTAHRACRAIYDRLGPVLAKRMTNPVLADLAYVILVPIAWLCGTMLQCIVPGFRDKADRLYRR